MVGHLHRCALAAGLQQIPGRLVDLVPAPQVAGVVIGHQTLELVGDLDLALLDQLLQELRVVPHLVVAAKGRVLLFEAVVAVGAGGQDLFDLVG